MEKEFFACPAIRMASSSWWAAKAGADIRISGSQLGRSIFLEKFWKVYSDLAGEDLETPDGESEGKELYAYHPLL